MSEPLVFAVPSKGRLVEQAAEMLADNGIKLKKVGHERGYRGEIEGMRHVEVTFVSASEVAALLRTGKAHLGITGEDLVREQITDADMRVEFLKRFDFGHADVVVAVPAWWVDVRSMADLDEITSAFRRAHGRWYRVATKYLNLTRRFFAASGVTDYRIVESLGATEGTPAAGTADLIVDITTTGETLRANGLKVLDDGIVLHSQAALVASDVASWSPHAREAQNEIMTRLGL
jgi:ATP phosphoribosyltransferase